LKGGSRVWNPFDRRSDNKRVLDAVVSGLPRPQWIGDHGHVSSRFVHEALAGWSGAWSPTQPARGMHRVRRFFARQPQVTASDIADL